MNIKSKAIDQLMKDLDKHFLKKQLMNDEKSEVEVEGEPNESLENTPEGQIKHELLEGKDIEKEEHPMLTSSEAEQVAKDHVDEDEEYYDEENETEEEPKGELPKHLTVSMSRIVADKKRQNEPQKNEKSEKINKLFKKGK